MARSDTPKSFWQFYSSVLVGALTEAYSAADKVIAGAAVVIFFAALFSKELARRLETGWEGLSRWWAIAPVCVLLIYRALRANYERFESEVRRGDTAINELDEALAGPKFSGHFYQFQIFPRSGAIDPDMFHQAANLVDGRDALDKAEPPTFDYDVFVEIYLQNDSPGKGSILEYIFEIEFHGKYTKLDREFSFRGWRLEREESQMNAKDFLRVVKKKVYQAAPDLSVVASGILEQGKGADGWLHYVLKDVAYTEFDGKKKHDMRLTIHDGRGQPHVINRAWTGEPRPWRIAHDFSG
jgi:hypothetical protein